MDLASFSSGKGMVVSTDRFASQTGIEILKSGGNAVDAAVGIAFTMAVSYPSCGNIGGSGAMLYYGSDGTVSTFNFRSKAPMAATPDMFSDKNGKVQGGAEPEGILTIGIPGTVAGMQLAHRKLGKLSWKTLIAPAIELAEDGLVINQRLYDELKQNEKELRKYPSSTKVFFKKDGELHQKGDLFVQHDLAQTLKRIQLYDAEDFYCGEIAKRIVNFMEENDGIITAKDLKGYSVMEHEPLHGTYRGFDIYTVGPPNSGITLLEMFNILEGYDFRRIGHNTSEYLHILTEVMRLSQLDRIKYTGDPEYVEALPLNKLLLKEYASALRGRIDPLKASESKLDEVESFEEKRETTHFSVVDQEGNVASVTYTLNGDFGSYIVAEGTGVLLNNDMIDFDTAKPNLIEPGKRPRSSMIPTVISKEKKPVLVLGSPGGSIIPSVIMQIAINFIDYGMSLEEAVSAGRVYRAWMPDITLVEKESIASEDLRRYMEMGHKIYDEKIAKMNNAPYRDPQLGTTMCIYIDQVKKTYCGVADPRSGDPSAFGIS